MIRKADYDVRCDTKQTTFDEMSLNDPELNEDQETKSLYDVTSTCMTSPSPK